MEHITDYIILENSSKIGLQYSVLEHIRDGYRPLGGVSYKPEEADHSGGYYLQAMIKSK